MTKERFEREYNINLDTVNWKTIQSNVPDLTYEAAIVGRFAIINENGDYKLSEGASYCRFSHDLSKEREIAEEKSRRCDMIINGRDKAIIINMLFTTMRDKSFRLKYGKRTIKEMMELYDRIRYDDYCQENGIAYDEMSDMDKINAIVDDGERSKWDDV